MKVETVQLRRVFDLLMSHLEEHGAAAQELQRDFYWDMPSEALYDPYHRPENLDMGQLSDDWNELQRIDQGETPPVGPALVWLASILRALGEEAQV